MAPDDAYKKRVEEGTRNTNYALLLVPNGVEMEQFSTLRQAISMGVIPVQRALGPP
jgi:hypothetical protein